MGASRVPQTGILLLALLQATASLECYTTHNLGSMLPIGVEPIEQADCLDMFEIKLKDEQDANERRSDEEYVANLPTCYVSCEGKTREEAKCEFMCTRHATCRMMEEAAATMTSISNQLANPELFETRCEVDPDSCKPKFYYHQCCSDKNLCNKPIPAIE